MKTGLNTPLVAIKCLVYNHEPYLRDCLEGFVMQQTNFPFVAIVHDDASTDNSALIIREYAEKYPDIIKPIYEIENQYSKRDGSLGRVVNSAVDATGAKYVALCEGDDYWTDPQKLQKQVDFMETNEEVGLCYTDFSTCDTEGNIIEESSFTTGRRIPILTFENHLLRQGFIAPMTWMYRKDLYEQIRGNMLTGVTDGSFVVALEIFANSKVAFLPINAANYRISLDSASRPKSLEGRFKYRKGVYTVQHEYARRYLKSDVILKLLKREEIYELLPIALKLKNTQYIEECKQWSIENNLSIDLAYSLYYTQKQLNQISSSCAYRLGKFLLKPFSWLRRKLVKQSNK